MAFKHNSLDLNESELNATAPGGEHYCWNSLFFHWNVLLAERQINLLADDEIPTHFLVCSVALSTDQVLSAYSTSSQDWFW